MTPEQTKKFKYWQTRTIIVSMIGYALYYFVRKNFNTAMPSIEATFGITKTQLGIFLTLNGVIYGVSRFINGFIADRVSARKFMALGLALCALVNIGFGFSDKMALLITGTAGGSEYITALTIIMGSILLLNGYFQGMGVPPVSPLMTHWVPANELATKMSIWNMSHSIGAGLIFVLGALLVHHFDNSAWRLCFLVPAVISLIGAGALYLTLRDKPSSVGLPELETQAAPPAVGEKKETTSDSAYHKAFLRRMVFGNPIIWVLAVTNFFVYIVRFSMLDWGMMLLPGSKGVSVAVAGIMVAVFEFVGGNLGMVVAGWATDHIFGSRAHRTCVFCMLGAIISTMDTYYLVGGEIVSNDIIGVLRKKPLTDKQSIFISRIACVVFGVIGLSVAFKFKLVYDAMILVTSLSMSALFVPMMAAIMYDGKKTNMSGLCSMIVGILSWLWFNFNPLSIEALGGNVDPMLVSLPISFVAFLIGNQFGKVLNTGFVKPDGVNLEKGMIMTSSGPVSEEEYKKEIKVEWLGIDGALCLVYVALACFYSFGIINRIDWIIGWVAPLVAGISTTAIFLRYLYQVFTFGKTPAQKK